MIFMGHPVLDQTCNRPGSYCSLGLLKVGKFYEHVGLLVLLSIVIVTLPLLCRRHSLPIFVLI